MRAEYDFSKGKRGAVVPLKGKTRISIFIDNAILDAFRARAEKSGIGYQTMMNEALRQYLSDAEPPVTEAILRHVLRQEIPEYLHGAAPPTGGRHLKPKKRSDVMVELYSGKRVREFDQGEAELKPLLHRKRKTVR